MQPKLDKSGPIRSPNGKNPDPKRARPRAESVRWDCTVQVEHALDFGNVKKK